MGYPYGHYVIDDEHSIIARAFQGQIACILPRYRPVGFSGSVFPVYELSSLAPRGLSGAPLLSKLDPSQVRGIVIGNNKTEMRIYSEIEKISEGDSVQTVELIEPLYLGVAVLAAHIMSLKSHLLGGTVGDYLKK